MGNRADRRASAKIARQAMKRAKSPTESAILRAAAAFAGDDAADGLASHIANADFDRAWDRLADDLHDILEDRYAAFRAQVYAEAGLGVLHVVGANGAATGMGTRLFLCPVSGEPGRLAAFAEDAEQVGRLETSLREFGVVPDDGRCLVLPLVLPVAAFVPQATTPGQVRALHDQLAARLVERLSGMSPPAPKEVRGILAEFPEPGADAASGDVAFGALLGIELVPDPDAAGTSVSDDDLDAEDMARTAAVASWHDSYAADLAGVAIDAPLDWPACAAALAWEAIRVPMEAALRRHGVPEGRPETVHCATDGDGRVVVSAVAGGVAVGPFPAPAELVWFDPDEFFGRAEAGAETLIEYDDERAVLATLLPAG